MLGVNSENNKCCKLLCIIPFDNLIPSELEADDFIHDATNWCGQDEIERTLGFIKMKQTGRKIALDNPITFRGSDSDWGRECPWQFEVDEIYELEDV